MFIKLKVFNLKWYKCLCKTIHHIFLTGKNGRCRRLLYNLNSDKKSYSYRNLNIIVDAKRVIAYKFRNTRIKNDTHNVSKQ